MIKKLLFVSAILLSFSYQAQILFKVNAPAAVKGNYAFTYTSDPSNTSPWGASIQSAINMVSGDLVLVAHGTGSDSLGCNNSGSDLTGKIAVIYRGTCTFYNKVLYAQNRHAKAVVIINNVKGNPIGMLGGTTLENAAITIPAIQISKDDGAKLRAQLDLAQTVSVQIGNFQNYYGNNVSIYNDQTAIPRSYATPKLTVNDASEYFVPLKSYVFNRGANDLNNVRLNVAIKKGSQILFKDSTALSTIVSGDTLQLSLPDYQLTDVSIGKYTLYYYTNLGSTVDEDKNDDTLKYDFEITNNIYSLAPLNSLGHPIANVHTHSNDAGLVAFKQCMNYTNGNAKRIGAEGLYFSAKLDTVVGTIDGEEFTIETSKWTDKYGTPFASNFDSLEVLNSTIYNIKGNLQDSMLYVPFTNSIPLENDIRYLICVTPSNPKISIGYNTNLDYNLNNFIFQESANPMRVQTGSSTKWFSGFLPSAVPAFGLVTADVATLGLSTSSAISEGYVYPNPTNNLVTISLNSEKAAKLAITDISGKVVMNSNLDLINGKSTVNIHSLESGMYIFNITLENGKTAQYNVVKN